MTNCTECGSSEVATSIELLAEGDSKFSRQPYRVVSCEDCGHEETQDAVRVGVDE